MSGRILCAVDLEKPWVKGIVEDLKGGYEVSFCGNCADEILSIDLNGVDLLIIDPVMTKNKLDPRPGNLFAGMETVINLRVIDKTIPIMAFAVVNCGEFTNLLNVGVNTVVDLKGLDGAMLYVLKAIKLLIESARARR